MKKKISEILCEPLVKRLPWYFDVLEATVSRSTCVRKKVAAIIINPGNYHIVSIGYNGPPSKMPHCNEGGCIVIDGHCQGTLHAEVNALANLESVYDDLWLLSVYQPCWYCIKMLMSFRVSLVMYCLPYEDSIRDEVLEKWGVSSGIVFNPDDSDMTEVGVPGMGVMFLKREFS